MANSCSTLAGNRSGPQAFPWLSFCNSFRPPWHVTLISGIDGTSVPSGVGILILSSFVQVDKYGRVSISTLSFGLAWSVPLSTGIFPKGLDVFYFGCCSGSDVVYELPVRLSFSFLMSCLGLLVHSHILCFPCLPLFCKKFLTFANEGLDLFGNPWLHNFVAFMVLAFNRTISVNVYFS